MTRAPWEITREMFLSVEETASLLGHVRGREADAGELDRGPRLLDRLIVEGLLFSGLRNSEFCTLKLADTVIGARQSIFIVRGRGETGRTVQVPTAVSGLVKQYVSHTRGKKARLDLRQPLVLNERSRGYERTALYRRVVRILAEAGLGERASVQLLRHTYGYLAYLQTGGNLLFVQRQLGHAHPMITSIYAQFVKESYPEMAEKVFDIEESDEKVH